MIVRVSNFGYIEAFLTIDWVILSMTLNIENNNYSKKFPEIVVPKVILI